MDKIFFAELLVSVLIVAGGIFSLVGSFGLIKLKDLMTRLHAPTKATTLGVGSTLLASMVYFLVFESKISMHEILILLFLFLTAPITAHFVAKAYLLRHTDPQKDLPQTQRPHGWSTFDAPPASPTKPPSPKADG
ncbi:Na+/H+ antiporter subunit G [Thiorhodospira sibirica]|uniref:Na+/H+ antiporter subunit G n=1 Tax=Thiorhodospira sibirica TaxID=154347 RepID=UPI00022C33A7|nr:Na+/H+ antiporter subunit G [Thiorhodospira sibirica]